MKEPRLFNPDSFQDYGNKVQLKNGRWVCARPWRLSRLLFKWRLKLAYNVFIGKYDALIWIED